MDTQNDVSCFCCRKLIQSRRLTNEKLTRKLLEAWNEMKIQATLESNRRIEKSMQVLKYKEIVHFVEVEGTRGVTATTITAYDMIRLQLKCQNLKKKNALFEQELLRMQEAVQALDLSSLSSQLHDILSQNPV